MSKKILIIGSGIAGIAASLKLKSYGLESTIVDKGNFIGGRIGTREKKILSKITEFMICNSLFPTFIRGHYLTFLTPIQNPSWQTVFLTWV